MTAKDLQYTAISISIVLLLIFSTVGCGVKPQNTDYDTFSAGKRYRRLLCR